MTASDTYVVTSHLTVATDGAPALEQAFADRLGEVDDTPGFQRLEVWRDSTQEGTYVMVSWWDSEEEFRAYMGSPAHRRSHARVPRDPHPPRATGIARYDVVAR